MNLRAPYEIIIAKKLEQELPVRDMSDAIWSKIELQLDAKPNMNVDTSADPLKPIRGLVTGKTFVIVIVGILTLFLFFVLKNKMKKNQERFKKLPPAQQKIKINQYSFPTDTNSNKVKSVPYSQITKPFEKIMSFVKPVDAVIAKPDSINKLMPVLVLPDPDFTILAPSVKHNSLDSYITAPSFRKPRGVPIPTNEVYKIKSKQNDSLKREN